MATLSIFRFVELPTREEIVSKINGKVNNNFWFKARKSKYNEHEVDIDIWFEEAIELGLKKGLGEDSKEAIETLMKEGKKKVVRRIYTYIDLNLKTLEIYRGKDTVTESLVDNLNEFLETKFTPCVLTSEQLARIGSEHSKEVKQAIFKYIHGLWYHILKGRHLEVNAKYNKYLEQKPDSLRAITIVPKIKFMNGRDYQVTVNGDKGTIGFSDGFFRWKPRFEIKQIVTMLVSVSDFNF